MLAIMGLAPVSLESRETSVTSVLVVSWAALPTAQVAVNVSKTGTL